MAKHSRPNPIADAQKKRSWVGALGGLVSAGLALGLLNEVQASALTAAAESLTVAGAFLLPFLTGLLHSFAVGKKAKEGTTPVEDPKDNEGNPLVPFLNTWENEGGLVLFGDELDDEDETDYEVEPEIEDEEDEEIPTPEFEDFEDNSLMKEDK